MKRSVILRTFSLVLALVLCLSSVPMAASAASTFTYTDKSTGLKLSVPSDWDMEEVDDDWFNVVFSSSTNNVSTMAYGNQDRWGMLTSTQQKKVSRSNYDNDQFTKAEMAKIIGCTSSQIKMVTLGGKEYFQAQFEDSYTYGGYKFTRDVMVWVRVYNGWLHIFYYSGNLSGTLFNSFKSMIRGATYSTKSVSTDDTPAPTEAPNDKATTYSKAVSAYNRGRYSEAKKLFNSISTYKDSAKYLRLIRIRNAGSNTGMGGKVYKSTRGLTASDKKDIDAAANDFYFADTAEVLLCNSDVACYYLRGDWLGGSKCYIKFYASSAGTSYYIGSKLSTNYSDTYSINDGELRVNITGNNKLTLKLTLLSPDCMEVYTYEKGGKTYTLNR